MKDSLTSLNRADFGARYQNTYGFFTTTTGRRILVYVNQVNAHRVQFTDNDNAIAANLFEARVDQGVEFEFIQVTRGFFNSGNDVIFLTRRPARQWKRGISPENTLVYRLLDNRLVQINMTHSLLSSIFVEKSQDVSQLWKNFTTIKRSAVALSNHFAINRTGQVYFFDRVVGQLKDNVVSLQSNAVLQEFSDICRRNDIPLEVRVA